MTDDAEPIRPSHDDPTLEGPTQVTSSGTTPGATPTSERAAVDPGSGAGAHERVPTPEGAGPTPPPGPATPGTHRPDAEATEGSRPRPDVAGGAPPGWGSTPPPSPPSQPGRRPRRWPAVLAAALVGALVGAGSAAGIYLAFDDRDDETPTAVVVRPASRVETPGDIPEILAKVQPATVAISVRGDLGAECGRDMEPGSIVEGAGSGFVVSEDGYVVTNSHVVGGADEIQVEFTNGDVYDAEIVGRDATHDLAVLKIDASGLPAVELGDSDDVVVGDAAIVIGNALGLEGSPSVTSGIVSALGRRVPTPCGVLENALQTDAAINSGNSGGPVVDAHGRVIAIATAIADPSVSQSVGFAIAISHAAPIIEDLRSGLRPAFLGVSTQSIDELVAAELDLEVGSGALVVEVNPDTPAEEAGIRVEDIIVRVGDRDITSSGDVADAVREHRPGDEIEIVLDRDGEEVVVRAVLAERPDST